MHLWERSVSSRDRLPMQLCAPDFSAGPTRDAIHQLLAHHRVHELLAQSVSALFGMCELEHLATILRLEPQRIDPGTGYLCRLGLKGKHCSPCAVRSHLEPSAI